MSYRNETVIYMDMDHVLCDYEEAWAKQKNLFPDLEFPQSQPGMYIRMNPLPDAIETYRWLDDHPETDVYILTAPSVHNSHCYSEKRDWVEKYLGLSVVENLIITPHKNLNKGHYLIDDMASGKGQESFEGSLILFGSNEFPDCYPFVLSLKNLSIRTARSLKPGHGMPFLIQNPVLPTISG